MNFKWIPSLFGISSSSSTTSILPTTTTSDDKTSSLPKKLMTKKDINNNNNGGGSNNYVPEPIENTLEYQQETSKLRSHENEITKAEKIKELFDYLDAKYENKIEYALRLIDLEKEIILGIRFSGKIIGLRIPFLNIYQNTFPLVPISTSFSLKKPPPLPPLTTTNEINIEISPPQDAWIKLPNVFPYCSKSTSATITRDAKKSNMYHIILDPINENPHVAEISLISCQIRQLNLNVNVPIQLCLFQNEIVQTLPNILNVPEQQQQQQPFIRNPSQQMTDAINFQPHRSIRPQEDEDDEKKEKDKENHIFKYEWNTWLPASNVGVIMTKRSVYASYNDNDEDDIFNSNINNGVGMLSTTTTTINKEGSNGWTSYKPLSSEQQELTGIVNITDYLTNQTNNNVDDSTKASPITTPNLLYSKYYLPECKLWSLYISPLSIGQVQAFANYKQIGEFEVVIERNLHTLIIFRKIIEHLSNFRNPFSDHLLLNILTNSFTKHCITHYRLASYAWEEILRYVRYNLNRSNRLKIDLMLRPFCENDFRKNINNNDATETKLSTTTDTPFMLEGSVEVFVSFRVFYKT